MSKRGFFKGLLIFVLIIFILIPAVLFYFFVYNETIKLPFAFDFDRTSDVPEIDQVLNAEDKFLYFQEIYSLDLFEDKVKESKVISLLKKQIEISKSIPKSVEDSTNIKIGLIDSIDGDITELGESPNGHCRAGFVRTMLGDKEIAGFLTVRHCFEDYQFSRLEDSDKVKFSLTNGIETELLKKDLLSNFYKFSGLKLEKYSYLGVDSFEDFPVFVAITDVNELSKLQNIVGLKISNNYKDGEYYIYPNVPNGLQLLITDDKLADDIMKKLHNSLPINIQMSFSENFDPLTKKYKNEKWLSDQVVGRIEENETVFCMGVAGDSGTPIFDKEGNVYGVYATASDILVNSNIQEKNGQYCESKLGVEIFR